MFILSYDVGTSGVKTCLYQLNDELVLVDAQLADYSLTVLPGGGAEQDPDEWWQAMIDATRAVASRHPDEIAQVAGLSFCSQMQALVLVDEDARPLRPAMSYMDQRAADEHRKGIGSGLKVAGMNANKLAQSLYYTGAVSASVKDPVWKYLWVKNHEPHVFARVHKWLDVKEYLIARMTGEFVMSQDSAFATLLMNVRTATPEWSERICSLFGVNPAHLPRIVSCTDAVGIMRPDVARELGLPEGIMVYAGGGDASLIGVGAGAGGVGDTHIYWGTSGWVVTVVDKRAIDVATSMASVVGAQPGRYNYWAELETAGKCFEWVRDHLAVDEIDMYLEKNEVTSRIECTYRSLYEYLSSVIAKAEPGSGGVIFTPWMHGNRCPFEDANARGMFFNIGLETGKTELLRSVIEGVCFHLRWFLERQNQKVGTSNVVRFAGGGALSDATSQILADICGCVVEAVNDPQNTGSVGAALLVAAGTGAIASVDDGRKFITVKKRFEPNPATRDVYDRSFAVFTTLYSANKRNFAALNAAHT